MPSLSSIVSVMICVVALLLFSPAKTIAQCDSGRGQAVVFYDVAPVSQTVFPVRSRPVVNWISTSASRFGQRAKAFRSRMGQRLGSRRGC